MNRIEQKFYANPALRRLADEACAGLDESAGECFPPSGNKNGPTEISGRAAVWGVPSAAMFGTDESPLKVPAGSFLPTSAAMDGFDE